MKLRNLFTVKWLLVVVVVIVFLGFNVGGSTKDYKGYAYFRADHYLGCTWTCSGRVGYGSPVYVYRSEESVSDVLKQIGTLAPNVDILRERDIPLVLNFFYVNGWEVVSHSSETRGGSSGTLYIRFTCVLRRKQKQ